MDDPPRREVQTASTPSGDAARRDAIMVNTIRPPA